MAKFSTKSFSKLSSCTRDIQTILQEVVKYRDCTIVEGHREAEAQHDHWKKGRKLKRPSDIKIADNWEIINKSKVVTYKDGYTKLSKHQKYPSIAIDVVPYPEMWNSKEAFHEFRGVVKYVQDRLFKEGRIDHKLSNGFDLWDGWDLPHWQIDR